MFELGKAGLSRSVQSNSSRRWIRGGREIQKKGASKKEKDTGNMNRKVGGQVQRLGAIWLQRHRAQFGRGFVNHSYIHWGTNEGMSSMWGCKAASKTSHHSLYIVHYTGSLALCRAVWAFIDIFHKLYGWLIVSHNASWKAVYNRWSTEASRIVVLLSDRREERLPCDLKPKLCHLWIKGNEQTLYWKELNVVADTP